ncbi:unnamed protein product [Symbiodinium sp. CCMP2592]|nr:unnamed protein product [Symbiodinium sp. CCMP2592]
MAGPAVAERLERVEDRLGEWEATLRVRVKGATKVLEEGKTLETTSREFWRLKEQVGTLLQEATEDVLKGLDPTTVPPELIGGLGQVFNKENLVGVFPLGGKFSATDTVDIRFHPGLGGLRANFLIKNVLSPLLKKVPEPRPLEVWVPLSMAESKRRQRKRDASGLFPMVVSYQGLHLLFPFSLFSLFSLSSPSLCLPLSLSLSSLPLDALRCAQ